MRRLDAALALVLGLVSQGGVEPHAVQGAFALSFDESKVRYHFTRAGPLQPEKLTPMGIGKQWLLCICGFSMIRSFDVPMIRCFAAPILKFHFHQAQALCGRGRAGLGAVARGQYPRDIVGDELTSSNFDECPNDVANHITKETVPCDFIHEH